MNPQLPTPIFQCPAFPAFSEFPPKDRRWFCGIIIDCLTPRLVHHDPWIQDAVGVKGPFDPSHEFDFRFAEHDVHIRFPEKSGAMFGGNGSLIFIHRQVIHFRPHLIDTFRNFSVHLEENIMDIAIPKMAKGH